MGFDIGSMFGGGLLGESSGISTHRIFGSKPKVAKYVPVTAQEAQKSAIAGNIAAFPDIAKLGDLYSSQELAQLEKILPGYSDQVSAGRATTDALFKQATPLLAGQIPQDVQDAVQRSSAYQALRGGYSGSEMAQALTARDLGLTSLDLLGRGANLAGQGVNSMQAWDALARKDILEPGSQLLSPAQQIQQENLNAAMKQASKQAAYNVRAAPDPTQSGVFNSIMQVLGEVLSVYGGGGGYKSQQFTQGVPTQSFNAGYGSGGGFNVFGGGGGGQSNVYNSDPYFTGGG